MCFSLATRQLRANKNCVLIPALILTARDSSEDYTRQEDNLEMRVKQKSTVKAGQRILCSYQAAGLMTKFRVPVGTSSFFFYFQSLQTGPGDHPVYWYIRLGSLFHGGKAARV